MIELNAPIAAGAKVMFYCHDTYGLGHLRRTLTLTNHLQATVPDVSQLVVTGSPVADWFRFPPGTDYVKLPSVTKNALGEYQPRSLSGAFEVVRNMRQDILLSAARHFEPDYFIVDHAPAGMRGEALKTLRHLKSELPCTKLVVGLRDVMDEGSAVRRLWATEGIYELFDDIYDLILVYGNRNLYDVVDEYGLSSRAAAKTRFVGYLGRQPGSQSREQIRASLGMQTDRLVVVTGGGGGDADSLYAAVMRDLQVAKGADFDCLIVNGPFLPESDSVASRERFMREGRVHFLDFTSDLTSYLGAADVVISMGGYNSVCEILSLKKPAIIVPRTAPRTEQLIRARMLASQGLLQMIHPNDLTPGRLIAATQELLAKSSGERPYFPMDGLGNVVKALCSLVRCQPMPRQPLSADGSLGAVNFAA